MNFVFPLSRSVTTWVISMINMFFLILNLESPTDPGPQDLGGYSGLRIHLFSFASLISFVSFIAFMSVVSFIAFIHFIRRAWFLARRPAGRPAGCHAGWLSLGFSWRLCGYSWFLACGVRPAGQLASWGLVFDRPGLWPAGRPAGAWFVAAGPAGWLDGCEIPGRTTRVCRHGNKVILL